MSATTHSLHDNTLEDIDQLADADLLAAVLGGGPRASSLAASLLTSAGGLARLMRPGDHDDLLASLRPSDRRRLASSLALGRRALVRAAQESAAQLAHPDRVAAWAKARLSPLSHEELWLLALDGRNRLIAERRVAQGGLHSCVTSVRDVLRHALRAAASTFVLVHNHPSGDPAPSADDARLTLEVGRASLLVGVPLVDHVIVAGARHASLLELGLVPG